MIIMKKTLQWALRIVLGIAIFSLCHPRGIFTRRKSGKATKQARKIISIRISAALAYFPY
jgi:hypothetical protein